MEVEREEVVGETISDETGDVVLEGEKSNTLEKRPMEKMQSKIDVANRVNTGKLVWLD